MIGLSGVTDGLGVAALVVEEDEDDVGSREKSMVNAEVVAGPVGVGVVAAIGAAGVAGNPKVPLN